MRTFGLIALLGCLGGLEGQAFALTTLALGALMVIFLNIHSLREPVHTSELTTSVALLVICFAGILCGQGHTLTPVALAVVTAALLAWKGTLHGFSTALSEAELRSAILLAMLTFVIYPALPSGGFGPHQSLVPREAWMTVILIAGIGFVNYILLKIYGNRGIELAGFLGGLVNSTVTTNELIQRTQSGNETMVHFAGRGILIANSAMLLRNALLLGVLAHQVLQLAWLPCLIMMAVLIILAKIWAHGPEEVSDQAAVHLSSPFSLISALKFGALLLFLQLLDVAAQAALGDAGVYATAFLGGIISSASTVAALAGLAQRGQLVFAVAGHAAILASIASLLTTLPLVWRSQHVQFSLRIIRAMVIAALLGLLSSLAMIT